MDIDRSIDEIADHGELREGDSRHSLSRRALLAGGAGVAGLVAGAGLLGRNQPASAAETNTGIPTNNTNPSEAFLQFALPSNSAILPVGETVDNEYSKWIRVPTFSFGADNTVSLGTAGGGAGAGKATFSKFIITKPVDNASPQLFKALATGAHFKEAKLALRLGAGPGNGKSYLMFVFGLVFVADIQWSGGDASLAEEQVTFEYGQLGILYRIVNSNGTLGPQNVATWDRVVNNSWTPPLP